MRICTIARSLTSMPKGATMSSMPTLPIEEMVRNLTSNSARIIRAAFRQHDGTDAILRTTKPFRKIDTNHPDAMFMACANYTWRMLCFDYVAFRPHNCMPCTADFDLHTVLKAQGDCDDMHQAVRNMTTVLDGEIKMAESVMPITAQRGVMSWWGLV